MGGGKVQIMDVSVSNGKQRKSTGPGRCGRSENSGFALGLVVHRELNPRKARLEEEA